MREWRPLHAAGLIITDTDGNQYRITPAAAWDAPEGDDNRSGCYYEDEERPDGAIPLYRIEIQ